MSPGYKLNKIMSEIKLTAKGKSYWESKGAYQKEYDELYDEMVPSSGHSETLAGEVLRAVSRLGYEYYNNGNCNACEVTENEGDWIECEYCHGSGMVDDENDEDGEQIECPECGGEGGYYEEVEDDYSVDEFYAQFLDLLEGVFQEEGWNDATQAVEDVREIILNSISYHDNDMLFSEFNETSYAHLTDYAMAWIIKHKDEKTSLPKEYKN